MLREFFGISQISDATTAKRMKIDRYCQRQHCKHVELEQFWHAFTSRGFVSDSWAFLFSYSHKYATNRPRPMYLTENCQWWQLVLFILCLIFSCWMHAYVYFCTWHDCGVNSWSDVDDCLVRNKIIYRRGLLLKLQSTVRMWRCKHEYRPKWVVAGLTHSNKLTVWLLLCYLARRRPFVSRWLLFRNWCLTICRHLCTK